MHLILIYESHRLSASEHRDFILGIEDSTWTLLIHLKCERQASLIGEQWTGAQPTEMVAANGIGTSKSC